MFKLRVALVVVYLYSHYSWKATRSFQIDYDKLRKLRKLRKLGLSFI